MPKKVEWPCIIGGHPPLQVTDREQFASALAAKFGSMNPVGGLITVEKLGKSRTAAQVRYLFGVVYSTALRTERFGGWTKDEIHGYYKERLLKRTKELNGEIVEYIKSTTELDTVEMTDFIEGVRRDLASEHGIDTPDPGETV